MKTKNTALRRLVAGAGALTIAMAGVVASGTAFADPGPGQADAPDDGSLTIHKIVGAQGEAGDGTELDTPPTGEALNGAEFTIWQLGLRGGDDCVPLNLGNTDHWGFVPTDGAPADLDGVEASFCLVDEGTAGVTGDGDNADGEYVFEGLGRAGVDVGRGAGVGTGASGRPQ